MLTSSRGGPAAWLEAVARRRHRRDLFSLQRLHPLNRDANVRALRRTIHTVHLDENRVLCRVLGRYLMSVDTRDEGLAPHLMMDGFWELGLTEAIVRRAKRGMRALDAGANVGYFTLLFAGLCGPEGRVTAVEPDRETVEDLRRNVRLNGFEATVEVIHAALGAEPGEARLVRERGKPMNAHVSSGQVTGTSVAVLPVDAICEDLDLIKIDVEGSEERVWRGMSDLIGRGRPLTIFLEFNASRLPSPSAFLHELQACGFRLTRLEPWGEARVSLDEVLGASGSSDQMLILER